jgi:hypothetical protein
MSELCLSLRVAIPLCVYDKYPQTQLVYEIENGSTLTVGVPTGSLSVYIKYTYKC